MAATPLRNDSGDPTAHSDTMRSKEAYDYGERQSEGPLQRLTQWLMAHGIPENHSRSSAERIQSFYGEHVLRELASPVSVGIAGATTSYRLQDVWLHLVWPHLLSLHDPEQTLLVTKLNAEFTHSVALPLLPNPSVHLSYLSHDPNKDPVEDVLRRASQRRRADYLGCLTPATLHQDYTLAY